MEVIQGIPFWHANPLNSFKLFVFIVEGSGIASLNYPCIYVYLSVLSYESFKERTLK